MLVRASLREKRRVSLRLQAGVNTPDWIVLSWLKDNPILDASDTVKSLVRSVYGPAAYRAIGELSADQLRDMALTAMGELRFLIYKIGLEFAPDTCFSLPLLPGAEQPSVGINNSNKTPSFNSEKPLAEPEKEELFGSYSTEGINPF